MSQKDEVYRYNLDGQAYLLVLAVTTATPKLWDLYEVGHEPNADAAHEAFLVTPSYQDLPGWRFMTRYGDLTGALTAAEVAEIMIGIPA